MADDDLIERRADVKEMAIKVTGLEKLVDHLIQETRFNNRLTILAVCIIAAGKEILQAFK